MIEVRNLTKRYGNHEAVRGLSFEVSKGEICGFLGPNGAGKSTTLRMLTGFLEPTEGAIKIGPVDALAQPLEARRQIGYMPESCPLYPEMRVREYLRYRAELKGLPRGQIGAQVDKALKDAAVDDVAERIIGQLSKGYRQRVGLADALVADPPLLILDEPTAGLDPNQIRQVRELIKRLAVAKTVLLSTHILPEVEALCDRVLILNKGRLVSEGDPSRLREDSGARAVIVLQGRGALDAFREVFSKLDGMKVQKLEERASLRDVPLVHASIEATDPDAVEVIFSAVAAAGLTLRELRQKQASLEEVFSNLTTAERREEEE